MLRSCPPRSAEAFDLSRLMTRIRSRYSRLVAAALAIAATLCATPVEAQQPIHVTDIAGRDVTLAGPAKRILLGQGRHLPALALIHPDPVSLLVGWQGDMRRTDAPTYALYRDKFPALDSLPIVGEGNPESFSIEKALALKPDVAVLSLYVAGMRHGSTAPSSIVQRFEAAGIPVVIVDFFANPLRDTVPSIRILGKITGREQAADELVNFYQKHVAYLKETIAANHPELPTVFMHAHAGGNECCYSSGKGTFDDFISLAGGRNIAAGVIPGSTGEISLEFLIAKNPDVYVATGGAHLARSGGFVLGTGVDAAAARTRLKELISRPGLSGLSAVTSGRAHGLWHMFNDTPAHVVALEWLAKWFHPQLFKDLDPAATMKALNALSAVPLQGTYWVDKP